MAGPSLCIMFSRSCAALLAVACFLGCLTASAHATIGPQPTFDVTQYGAVGDGKTDDTAAVTKASAALMESPNGGTLYFPAGTFLMMEQPAGFSYILLQTNMTGATATYNVLGASAQTTSLIFNASRGGLVYAAGTNGGAISGSIRQLAVVALVTPGSTSQCVAIFLENSAVYALENLIVFAPEGVFDATAISVVTSHTVFLHDIFIANFTTATFLDGGDDFVLEKLNLVGATDDQYGTVGLWVISSATNVRISDVVFTDFSDAVIVGMDVGQSPSSSVISIARVEFLNNVFGVLVFDNSSVSISNSLFNATGNQQTNGVATPAQMYNIGANIIISHSVFNGVTTGVYATFGHFTVEDTLFNNTFVGFDTEPIGSSDDGRAPYVITGCKFESNVQSAIKITSPNGVYVIADNVCASNGQPDISVVPCDQACIIENNAQCTVGTVQSKASKIETIVLVN